MKRLITQKRWKDHLRRRQISELNCGIRVKRPYWAPRAKRDYVTIRVPDQFSLIRNPEEMNAFLQTLRAYSKKAHISLDLRDVSEITTEAIAALVATLSSLEDTNSKGNMPLRPEAREVLLRSGFFEHVQSTVPLPDGQLGKIMERKSKLVKARTAWSLIECGTSQAFGAKKRSDATRAAYTTLVELMGNTHNHAAGDKPELETWWANSYGDEKRKRVCYSFLDTGVGIFRSVRVGLIKQAFRLLGVTENADILPEILQGRIESRTGLPYRGKGLPAIYKKSRSGDIKSLFIVTNNVFADISNDEYRTLNAHFPGTLLYWECEE